MHVINTGMNYSYFNETVVTERYELEAGAENGEGERERHIDLFN